MSSVKSVKSVKPGLGGSELGGVRAGDVWQDADGDSYVVSWVGRMGVVGFRRADDRAGGPESVMDVVRFVTRFAPQARAA